MRFRGTLTVSARTLCNSFFFLSQTDGCRPCANVAVLFRSLNGSARLEVVKKTGHAPQLEDPARFNKLMLDFLLAAHKPDPSV